MLFYVIVFHKAEFYKQTLQGVKQAIVQLDHSGVPYKRPADFYAESVKPDSHMAKIKQVLINEKRKIEETEERKKQRDYKKFAREVQSQKVQARFVLCVIY